MKCKMNRFMIIFFRVLFCVLLPFVLLLLSYKITVGLWHWTSTQEKVIDFLYHAQDFEGATALEMSHLNDVRLVMNKADWFFWISLACLMFIVGSNFQDKKELRKMSLYGGIATVCFISLFVFGAIFGFGWLFTRFHLVFFPQGNWLFSYDSFLIHNFSFEFFEKISILIFLLTFLWGSLFIGIALYLKYGIIKNH